MQIWTFFITLALVYCLNAMPSNPRSIVVNGAAVSWTAPSDVGSGLHSYRVYRGNVLYQEIPGTGTSLTTGSNVDMPVEVQAVDKSGAVSGLARRNPAWTKTFAGAINQITAGTVDADDNVIVGGFFSGEINFGTGVLSSSPRQYALFLAKFSSDGVCQWAKRFVFPASATLNGVAADSEGSVIIGGHFQNNLDFGGGDLQSLGSYDIFVAKFDADGDHVWSNRYGGQSSYGDLLYSVAVDSSDNIFIGGYFSEDANFGGEWLGQAWTGQHPFVAKYNSSGEHVWSKTFPAPGGVSVSGIATDSNDRVIITGYFGATINFGGDTLVTIGSGDVFLAVFSNDGTHVWSDSYGGYYTDKGYAVAVDGSDNILLTAVYSDLFGPVLFGGSQINPARAAGSAQVAVAKYTSAGSHVWSFGFGSASHDNPTAIKADSNDNVIVAGIVGASVDFGGGVLPGLGSYEGFIAKYNSDGENISGELISGGGQDSVACLAVDSEGYIIAAGSFQSVEVSIGGQPYANSGTSFNSFIYKKAP